MEPPQPSGDLRIRRLDEAGAARAIPALGAVLIDCVEGGASVSFMPPMTAAKAARFWRLGSPCATTFFYKALG